MTEPTPELPTFTVEVLGRTMAMNAPTEMQLVVMNMTLKRASSAKPGDADYAGKALEAMSRTLDILQTNLVDEADRIWIEDQAVARKFLSEQALDLMNQVSERLADLNAEEAPRRVRRATRTR